MFNFLLKKTSKYKSSTCLVRASPTSFILNGGITQSLQVKQYHKVVKCYIQNFNDVSCCSGKLHVRGI